LHSHSFLEAVTVFVPQKQIPHELLFFFALPITNFLEVQEAHHQVHKSADIVQHSCRGLSNLEQIEHCYTGIRCS
jgi:hypothetical protein